MKNDPADLDISVLGGLSVRRAGVEVELPASKKTRALLGYLLLTRRPHRRDRLCEMFWDRTDDPKAALRWALTKLRPVVNSPDCERIVADRERISFSQTGVTSDAGNLRALLAQPAEDAARFVEAIGPINPVLLDGLDLPDNDIYQAWLTAERDHVERDLDALRKAAEDPAAAAAARPTEPRDLLLQQKIRFCQAPDGVSIAYATVGDGPPIVKAANWLSHLELDWDAPIWSPLFRQLARDHTFIRYDERGNGLSDWRVGELNVDTFVADLETVVDALKLERFPLLGISQGAAVSIEYAARHPDRVSALILFGGYPAGWRIDATPDEIAEREAVMTLTRSGWGQENPAYRHIFSSTFMPGATAEQLAWFDNFQRQTTSADNAVRFLSAFGDIDVRHRLGEIAAPTLVLHSRNDRRIPWDIGRDLAAAIPDATLVTLESANHLLLEGEPAAAQFLAALRDFLNRAS